MLPRLQIKRPNAECKKSDTEHPVPVSDRFAILVEKYCPEKHEIGLNGLVTLQ